jgi:parallel beta-helix repeat protein
MNRNLVLSVVTGLLVIALLLSQCACTADTGDSSTGNAAPQNQPAGATVMTAHPPIRINSDTDPAWSSFPGRVISGFEINGTSVGYCIYIGNCTTAFTVKNCTLTGARFNSHPYYRGAGLELYKSWNATVKNNRLDKLDLGVYLFTSSDNSIENNNFTSANTSAVYLEYSNHNTIEGNLIGAGTTGVGLYSSEYNKISGNTITENTDGMLIEAANRNTISLNELSGNARGIYMQGYLGYCMGNTVYGNNFSNNGYGVRMDWDVNDNTVSNNDIRSSSQVGAYIEQSRLNRITHNNMTGNNLSIYFLSCDYHTVTYNVISGSAGLGISLYDSDFNRIHHNNFIGNNGTGAQAGDSPGMNFWNDTAEGNYWSDWTGPDTSPKDGIVDLPYNVTGGTAKDNYPLADPVSDAGIKVPEAVFPFFTALIACVLLAGFCAFVRSRKRGK